MIKNICLYLFLMLILFPLNLEASWYVEFKKSIDASLSPLWMFGKIAGFMIMMWAVYELVKDDKGQGGDMAGKFLNVFLKLLVSSIFIAAGDIYQKVMSF